MEKLKIRCKECNKELEGHPIRLVSCGCPNMATVRADKISAIDLSKVVIVNSYKVQQKSGVLSSEDIAWQESRRNRKVRKLDFEIR